MNKIIILIAVITVNCFAGEFLRLSEFGEQKTEAKYDSLWVDNPIADIEMIFTDTLKVNISWVFNEFPDDIIGIPTVDNPLLITADISQDINNDLILEVISKNQHGRTNVTYTAYFYEYAFTDSLQTDSIVVDTLTMTDTFNVSVYNPLFELREWGSSYSFLPENCIGSGSIEWKAAVDFDLGQDIYELKEIEFGYGWDGTAQWKITEFSNVPGDSLIWNLDSAFCVSEFIGDSAEYIEIPADSSLQMTGKIAVVFTTTANFMSMDPSGNSDRTWIYSESTGWDHPEDISPDYSGAWYIRLLVNKLGIGGTGVEEVITTEKSPVLMRNYPNPFNNETVISWNMHESANAELNIFNSKGQLVRNLINGVKEKGAHSVIFNADGMQTGIYFYQLRINGKTESAEKMLFLK